MVNFQRFRNKIERQHKDIVVKFVTCVNYQGEAIWMRCGKGLQVQFSELDNPFLIEGNRIRHSFGFKLLRKLIQEIGFPYTAFTVYQ